AGASYDVEARAPRWERFISEISLGDVELIGFLQRALGYTMTGLTHERLLFVPHGSGDNGKSLLLATVGTVLGDYAQSAPPDLLLLQRNSSHPTSIARLAGARFVSMTEV